MAIFNGTLPVARETFYAGRRCGSLELDDICLQIGRASARVAPSVRTGRRVYVVSELYAAGGHTRLLEELILAAPGAEHLILATCGNLPSVIATQHVFRTDVARATRVRQALGTPAQRLADMSRAVADLRPATLVHLGHPNDPIATALMQPSPGRCLIVVHHNDSGFSLARSIPAAMHVSLDRRLQDFALRSWGLKTVLLLPTCREPEQRTVRSKGEFVTATCATSSKVPLENDPSYLDILRARFSKASGTHVHFGELEAAQLLILQKFLSRHGWSSRFSYAGPVESLALELGKVGAKLYLDSFPIGGGIAVIEAMCAGVAVCASDANLVLTGASWAYPGCFIWSNISQLEGLFGKIDAAELRDHSRRSRRWYSRHHAPATFARRLAHIIEG